MAYRQFDNVHGHRTLDQHVRTEYSEDGRLHRHRVVERGVTARYTTWAHNTKAHQHKMPDGSWTRPRFDLNPPEILPVASGQN
jgi:hypothetical protein